MAISATGTIAQQANAANLPRPFVMKEGGLDYILNLIRSAKSRIYIKVYIFTDVDEQITNELINAKARGVDVCVMIEPDPFYWEEKDFNPSYKIVRKLKNAGIPYRTTNPYFSQSKTTHEKSLIIDNTGIILTGNLCRSNFTKNMDMGVTVVGDAGILYQMQTVFLADWHRSTLFSFNQDLGLVISPHTAVANQSFSAKERILSFIYYAKSSVHLLNQTLSDTDILQALVEQKKRGLDVRVILADPNKVETNQAAILFLRQNGVEVSVLKKPYLHAKAIALDAEDSPIDNNFSFVGSQNFTDGGLIRNREMGLIFYDPQAAVEQVFRHCAVISQDAGRTYILSKESFKDAVLSLINLSSASVSIEANGTDDRDISASLNAALKRGVKVKIISNSGMPGAAAVFDNKISILSPCGFNAKTEESFTAAVSCDEGAVADISQELDKGFAYEQLADAKGAVFAKSKLKENILKLISAARATIYTESASLNDKDILKALMNKAKSGVTVKVILKDSEVNTRAYGCLKTAGAYVELLSAFDSKNNILLIDSDHVFISAVPFDKMAGKSVSDYSIAGSEVQVIQKADENFGRTWKIASIDQAKAKIYFKADELDADKDAKILDTLLSKAKEGVKVFIETNKISEELEFKIKRMSPSGNPVRLSISGKIKKGAYLFNIDGERVDFSKE